MMQKKGIYQFVQLLGLVVMAIGLSTICGYATQEERLYRWAGTVDVGMAFNTAMAFIIEGICFFLLAGVGRKNESN